MFTSRKNPAASGVELRAPDRRKLLGMIGSGSVGAVVAAAMPWNRALAAPNINQQGLSGTWYNPLTSGQGFVIDVFPDLLGNGIGLVFGGWFTFDTSPGGVTSQRWYSFSGELRDGQATTTLSLFSNSGGRFAEPPVTFAQSAGSGSLSFASCSQASFGYTMADGRSGTIALTRALSNITCIESGTPSGDSDFAFSGSWYDPNTSGQGLVLEINPNSLAAFVAWYTYAPDAAANAGVSAQRWFTGQAVYDRGERSIALVLYSTTGGVFDSSESVTTVAVGTAELSFSSCNAATLTYAFNVGEMTGRSGSIALVRGGATPGACLFGSTCSLIPSETEGPYPLSTVLSNSGIVRSDITEDRTGVPLTLVLKLVNINNACAPISNAAVYAWHCDKDGVYSGYANQSGGVNAVGKIFLRGVQVTGSNGQAVFSTIYPGWYNGRITHIHFQAYLNNALGGRATVTSQVAFPLDVTTAVYGSSLYAARGQNTSVTSFGADNVFSDGVSFQLANVAGSTSTGYVATLIVGIAG